MMSLLGVLSAGASPQIKPVAHGTLILIGNTRNAITISADSAIYTEGEKVQRTAKKIYSLGKFGACFFGGSAVLQLCDNGKIIDEDHFMPKATEWIGRNPNASVRDAYVSISDAIFQSIVNFNKQYPGTSARESESFASFGCVGYEAGIPIMLASDYFDPIAADQPPTVKKTELRLAPGFFVPFGRYKVADELLKGTSTSFAAVKNNPTVRKYRAARQAGTTYLLTTDAFLRLSRVCLESTRGRSTDQKLLSASANS